MILGKTFCCNSVPVKNGRPWMQNTAVSSDTAFQLWGCDWKSVSPV